jgi:hypothetical protein
MLVPLLCLDRLRLLRLPLSVTPAYTQSLSVYSKYVGRETRRRTIPFHSSPFASPFAFRPSLVCLHHREPSHLLHAVTFCPNVPFPRSLFSFLLEDRRACSSEHANEPKLGSDSRWPSIGCEIWCSTRKAGRMRGKIR